MTATVCFRGVSSVLPYEPPSLLSRRGVGVVRPDFPGADAGAGRCVAGDPVRAGRADRRADGLRQDAGGVSRRDRRAGARGRAVGFAGRDAHPVRLAAEGAVERHQSQSRSAARRHSRGAARAHDPRRRDPHLGAHRRHAAIRARADAAQAAAHRRHDARVAVHPARLAVGPRDAGDDAHGDRRRNPRGRRQQARLASGAVARAPRCAGRPPGHAHRPVGDAAADRRSRALSGRRARHRRGRQRAIVASSTAATCVIAISRSSCPTRRSKR